jgi:hypothetical protein
MVQVLVTALPDLVLYEGDDLAYAQLLVNNGIGRYQVNL